ncbi:hypothetical protein C1J03_21610 [Sulfitobacter sp. SK012]|nr:hypothetical protein C1J03_21610 [Sulfitobacter sp. SK012]
MLAALAGLLLVSPFIYLPDWFLIPALTAVGITLLIARTYWAYSQPMDPKAEQAQLRQRIVNGLKSKND